MHASHSGTFQFDEQHKPFRFGFGAMRIIGDHGWGAPNSVSNSVSVLKECLNLGINFIDTADSYGPNISEELIAKALHPYSEDLFIATKGGFERPSPLEWKINCRPERLEACVKESLQRLKLDRIDLYQLHRFDPDVPADEFLDKLKELQEKEYVLHLGLSEVSVAQIEQAQQYFKVASVQNKYSLTDRKWEAELNWTAAQNIAFIPWYPLDKGAIDHPGLKQLAAKYDCSIFQLALAWLLAKSPNMMPIPGTSSVKHLQENVASAKLDLEEKDVALLSEI